MKATTIIGILLIVLGILAVIFQGIVYTEKETIIDVGPIEAVAERERRIPVPPIIGGVAIVAGIVLIIVGTRKA